MTRFYKFLSRLTGSIRSGFRIWQARICGAMIGQGCRFEQSVDLSPDGYFGRQGSISIGDHGQLMKGVVLWPFGGQIALGTNVFVGHYTVIYGHGGVEIGDHTLISMHCRILSSNHTVPPAGTLIRSQPDLLLPTCIGRDVWLGAGVTVLGGVTIGDGCVVGAGAVVASDLPQYSIALGVPARVLRKRESKSEDTLSGLK